jgi:hypothetical protein
LERNQRSQSDQSLAAKLIRALLDGNAAGDIKPTSPLFRFAGGLATFTRRREEHQLPPD